VNINPATIQTLVGDLAVRVWVDGRRLPPAKKAEMH